jgi:hypothetical protein
MNAFYVTIASLVILLGFEIRHRITTEELTQLKADTSRLDREISRLKDELKKKQNIYEEYNPPA